MHVFISDTHMTDHEAGGSVSDAELVKLAEEVGRLAKRGNVTLVLLGDIIDFLRSPKWNECWDQYSHSAPWSVMNPHFTNFANNHPEKCALAIARDVSKRYSGFSQALEKLAESGRVKTVYVVGNHDYMLQVSVQLRREVCKFLSLSDRNKAEKPFPITYENEEASVYATHGNTYDPTNYHRFEEGYWAFGDAVVLRVVNRFTPEVCARLACTEATVIGQQAHQLDNIEPTSDVPVYVRWMADESLTTSHEQEAVLEVWSRIVTELLDLAVFKKNYEARDIQNTRAALSISRSTSFSDLVAKYASYFQRHDYRFHAEQLAAELKHRFRFIVFGHTHHPMMVPLSFSVNGQQGYYVNTGCWRQLVSRPSPRERGPFASVRVNALFRIDDAGRHYLSQECHTT